MGSNGQVWSFVILTLLGKLTVTHTNSLEGRRAPCQYEGEPVAVDHIDKHNCFSCICKNGFVECRKDNCPPTEGCHMLVEKTKNGCCQKCKGCIYQGQHFLSNTEWTDPDNPCKVLRCEAGIVTESDLQCYTPCSHPLPREPGQCCPTCPECKINGQIATDDRDVISDDPCLKCRCSRGRMICTKKACPVLQCTASRQHHPSGECCPRCLGTRTLIAAPKSCMIQSSLIREGQNLNTDRCTNCTCLNNTAICQRSACPILDCAPDLQKSVPGSCCKKCLIPEEVRTQCTYDGVTYEDGQAWKLNACRSCKCHRGMPNCAMTKCNVTLPCPTGTYQVKLPAECCPKCVEADGVCTVFGDPHYKTFDGKMYTFQGVGKYQLVSDCEQQTFAIRVANAVWGKSPKSSTSTRRVAVKYGDLRLNLQQNSRVKLNGKRIKLPYRKEGFVRIDKSKENVVVELQNGVRIFWTGKSYLEVSVPATFKSKVCGLCGNFNANVQDDLKTRRGRVLKDSEIVAFGSSWCSGSKSVCSKNARQMPKSPVSCPMSHRIEKNKCKLLADQDLFGECIGKLNYNKYYKTCKMDMCSCPDRKCYCESMMAYARECERLDVDLPNWRRISMCDSEPHKSTALGNFVKPPRFTDEEIEKLKRQSLNRTRGAGPRVPILIH